MKLKDKVAIITGAGSGFGRETSKLFAKEGASVLCVDLNLNTAEETAADIISEGGKAIALQADVSRESDVKNFIQKAVEEYGQIDILFNNAGIYLPGNVEETPLEDFEKAMAININAIFMATKYAMPYLKKTKGNIINTASAGGIIGFGGAIGYATSKGAVISFTRAVAVDYAQEGVRCNAIAPGTGVTGMTEDLLQDRSIADAFLAPIPIKRFGQVSDVANAALFLASDDASYITGHALPVDGGWTMS
ncbi:MAG: glucose 1-dehydrogenase [Gallicola sp.]|nr:glucose 1-dehydrogenase [Gallicola sp.]